MAVRAGATLWPGAKIGGSREIEPSAATLRPDERKLGAVAFKDTGTRRWFANNGSGA